METNKNTETLVAINGTASIQNFLKMLRVKPESQIIFAGLLFSIFYNSQFRGPVYLSDEVAYLARAQVFAGLGVEHPSQWFAGYSILISPLAALFDVQNIWFNLVVFQSVIASITAWLVIRIVFKLSRDTSKAEQIFATFIVAFYPTTVAMVGFAFTSVVFSFIYASVATVMLHFSERNPNSPAKYIIIGTLAGFLFWVHPTALAVIFSLCAVVFIGRRRGGFSLNALLMPAIILSLGAVYMVLVHPLAQIASAPAGTAQQGNSYAAYADNLLVFLSPEFWIKVLGGAVGQFYYASVATIGLVVAGAIFLTKYLRAGALSGQTNPKHLDLVAFMLLSPLVIAFLGSFAVAASGYGDKDLWTHGRYLETVMAPLLGFGAANLKKIKFRGIAIAVISISGIVISFASNHDWLFLAGNKINILSFWPSVLLPMGNYFFWGALAVVAVWISGHRPRLYWLAHVAIVALCLFSIQKFHSVNLDGYSSPTSLSSAVAQTEYKGCIGFDDSEASANVMGERKSIFDYYLAGANFSATTIENWRNSCDGPLLTANKPNALIMFNEGYLVAKNIEQGFYVIFKSNAESLNIKANLGPDFITSDTEPNFRCFFYGCMRLNAKALSRFSNVGTYADESLTSSGREGFLFYGPYDTSASGEYVVKLEIDLEHAGQVKLDSSSKGKSTDEPTSETLFEGRVNPGTKTLRAKIHYVDDKVEREIRLWVSDGTRISIKSLLVTQVEPEKN